MLTFSVSDALMKATRLKHVCMFVCVRANKRVKLKSVKHYLCTIGFLTLMLTFFSSTEKDIDDWTPWSPCSVTCGHGERKRTKSCGYSCTLTEASKCDLEPCPGNILLPSIFYFNTCIKYSDFYSDLQGFFSPTNRLIYPSLCR